jgi:hypothetical protein
MNLIEPVEEPKTPTDPIGRLVEASPSYSDFSFGGGGYSGSSSNSGGQRPDWARRVFTDGGSYFGGN